MKKSDITILPAYYNKYLPLIPQDDLLEALYGSLDAVKNLDLELLNRLGHQVYAPGKWTAHELLQHLIDTERIFCFRALSFARGDAAMLPGMDENAYSSNSGASARNIADIVSELITVRNASISLFKSFSPEIMRKTGFANNTENSVLALGFFIAGHQIHHLNMLSERYFTLVSATS